MRVLALLAIALLFAPLPALARDPMTKDGRFTICEFQNFDKCELLTESSLRRFQLSAEERRNFEALRRFTTAPNASLADLERTFGKASKVRPRRDRPNEMTIAWFHNSAGLNDLNAKCPECGIYVYLTNNVVANINYIVDGKFTLAWNRAAPKSPQ